MQESDAKPFERALSRLCAAFDVPVTDARREAYWRSFRKLSVLEFAGLVDTALVESTFDSLPTVGVLWDLHRKVESSTRPPVKRSPTLHERLCAYAAREFHSRLTPKEFRGPWRYIGDELVIDREDGSELKISAADIDSGQQALA